MNDEVIQYLRCPISHQPLRQIGAAELEPLNARIEAGELKNRAGEPVERRLERALRTADGRFVYPIWDEILTLIADEAIEQASESGED